MSQVHVVWDCRVQAKNSMDLCKQMLNKAGGVRPTSILVLQPQNTQIPKPLSTIMRMTLSKMFVGEDAVKFCFLDLSLLVNQNPDSTFIIVSDDVEHFARAFRLQKVEKAVFLTNQKLQWPLSDADWVKSLQFVAQKA